VTLTTRLLALALVLILPPATQPEDGGGAQMLSGTVAWDMDLFREYAKQTYQLDVAASPAPFPGQDLLKHVNAEFATRVMALMAVYQAAGGKEAGIVPRTGGLRTAKMQRDLYAMGRKQKPNTTGNEEGHWEDVDDSKIVTSTLVSWHNFGVAVDLCAYEGGKPKVVTIGGIAQQTLPSDTAWMQTTIQVAGDMGVVWGGWWDGAFDPAHVEWHPELFDPDSVATSGVALTDEQVKPGYVWKIPAEIYVFRGKPDDPAAPQSLDVLELGVDGKWIVLKKRRQIDHRSEMNWDGQWFMYDPPLRIFPVYIPTRELMLEGLDNPRYAMNSKVTLVSYQQTGTGTVRKARGEERGKAHVALSLTMKDYRMEGNYAVLQNTPRSPRKPPASLKKSDPKLYAQLAVQYQMVRDEEKKVQQEVRARYANMLATSVYDITVSVAPIDAGAGSEEKITGRYQQVDKDGFTVETDNEREGMMPTGGHIAVVIAWDRDNGVVGVGNLDVWTESAQKALEVKSVRCGEGEAWRCIWVSGTLPKFAKDHTEPPGWAASNPKPKPERKGGPSGSTLKP